MAISTFYQQALATIQAQRIARAAATTPVASAPTATAPTFTPVPTSFASPPPALPGIAPQPSTAMIYPSAGGYSGAPSFTDYSASPNVQTAAISPDPTALTGDTMTPQAQAENRAQLIKVVGVGILIWLILSKTGR